MINQFRERNFILSRYGPHLYGFVHRTFLEFFCADAVLAKFQHDRVLTIGEAQGPVPPALGRPVLAGGAPAARRGAARGTHRRS